MPISNQYIKISFFSPPKSIVQQHGKKPSGIDHLVIDCLFSTLFGITHLGQRAEQVYTVENQKKSVSISDTYTTIFYF